VDEEQGEAAASMHVLGWSKTKRSHEPAFGRKTIRRIVFNLPQRRGGLAERCPKQNKNALALWVGCH